MPERDGGFELAKGGSLGDLSSSSRLILSMGVKFESCMLLFSCKLRRSPSLPGLARLGRESCIVVPPSKVVQEDSCPLCFALPAFSLSSVSMQGLLSLGHFQLSLGNSSRA